MSASAQYANLNIDAKTVAAMASAYGVETGTEAYYNEQVKKILEKYTSAEVAAAPYSHLNFSIARPLPTLVFGAVRQRTTITSASTEWWPPK